MEYSKIANIATSLPHFRDSFPSPSFDAPLEYKSLASSSGIYIAPLSASSLKTYNDLSGSTVLKRKAHSPEVVHEPKKMMVPSFGRQRQESGCSISSTSSWSSSATFSTVSSASLATSSPSLSPSPRSAYYKSSSPSPAPSESTNDGDESNPLWQICAAIDMISDNHQSKKQISSGTTARPYTSGYYKKSFKSTTYGDESPYGVKVMFVAPNWLAEHIAKSKQVAALKRLQKKRFH
ncbi:hypothetical protein BGZ70_003378 [Mortierella alpina]|uniref:Uncharacterized protein n=1 Tax=Mortierella alpina TaxID=64518 RepID=A0A9P6JE06_MORAP|nr:hypothetical protein BGZ70_003378 [Mortierella alpina]